MESENNLVEKTIVASETNSKKKMILIVMTSILLTAVIVGVGMYFFLNKNNTKFPSGNEVTYQEVVRNQEISNSKNELFFGTGRQGKYSLINLQTGQPKDFIPSGYELVNQTEYLQFPTFLILEKDNILYSYSVINNLTNSIFSGGDVRLGPDQEVRVYPSITEKDQFIVKINLLDISQVSELDGSSPIISSRTYSFNASANKLVQIENTIVVDSCSKYDSKNQRFFVWPCGEGIGSATPLSIHSLNGKKQKDIITSADFDLSDGDYANIKYSNGLFFGTDFYNGSKIIVVDSDSVTPSKETYTLSNSLKDKFSKIDIYSMAIDKSNSTIVIGRASSILFLRYDANKKIIEDSSIPDANIYANFTFIFEDKLYYFAGKNIRVADIKTWKLEKSIPTAQSYNEITLFSF